MSFDQSLADRCRSILQHRRGIVERRMFGGLSFLLNGKMICGVIGRKLVVRLDPGTSYEKALSQPHVKPMDFTGRPMRGFIYVSPEGLSRSAALKKWLDIAVNFGKTIISKPATRKSKRTAAKRRSGSFRSRA